MDKEKVSELTMKLTELQEGHFYRMVIKHFDSTRHDCVVKCAQLQEFKNTAGYTVYHFKYFGGEIVCTDQDKSHVSSFYSPYREIKKIKYEITDRDLCNTGIEFIDDTHYKKLVNKNTYKTYEVKQ